MTFVKIRKNNYLTIIINAYNIGGYMMKVKGLYLLLSALSLLLIAGCSTSSSETVAAHDLELPKGVESEVPLPADASIMVHSQQDDYYSILYSPGVSYPEAVAFFSDKLSSNGWTLIEEEIPEREEGERMASWKAEGYGVELTVTLTAFGGAEGSNMTGFIMIEEIN